MIAIAKFQETRRLLALGNLSQRRIAAIVGVSRATVSAIAKGTYRLRDQRRNREEDFLPRGPVSRCPSCGALVQLPCLACRVEELKNRQRQILRAARQKARERALRQLLIAVRQANWDRDARASQRVA